MYLFRFLNTPLGEGAATQTFAPGGKYPRAATAPSSYLTALNANSTHRGAIHETLYIRPIWHMWNCKKYLAIYVLLMTKYSHCAIING